MHVYARESKGSSYRRYEYAPYPDIQGRYYDLQKEGYGMHIYGFDKKRHGFAPDKVKNSVRIVAYTEEMMRKYSIGTVLGFDDQTLKLPVGKVVAESFSIIAKRLDENGEPIYDFVRPERSEEGNLYYHLYEYEGKICIEATLSGQNSISEAAPQPTDPTAISEAAVAFLQDTFLPASGLPTPVSAPEDASENGSRMSESGSWMTFIRLIRQLRQMIMRRS